MDVLNVYMGFHGWLLGVQLLRNLLLIGIVVYQAEMIHTVWLINKSNKIMFNVCFVRMVIFWIKMEYVKNWKLHYVRMINLFIIKNGSTQQIQIIMSYTIIIFHYMVVSNVNLDMHQSVWWIKITLFVMTRLMILKRDLNKWQNIFQNVKIIKLLMLVLINSNVSFVRLNIFYVKVKNIVFHKLRIQIVNWLIQWIINVLNVKLGM